MATGHHPGFGLLLAPVAILGASGTTLHTAALVVNALLIGVVVLLTAALAREIAPDAGRWFVRIAALLAAVHPAVSVGARIAWPEPLLVAVIVGVALGAARWATSPRAAFIDLADAADQVDVAARLAAFSPAVTGPGGRPTQPVTDWGGMRPSASPVGLGAEPVTEWGGMRPPASPVGPGDEPTGPWARPARLRRRVRDGRRALLVAGLAAGGAVALHPRALALVVGLVIGVALGRPTRRDLGVAAAGIGIGLGASALALALAYEGPAGSDRLSDAAGAGAGAAATVGGQLVALGASTFGLAVLGVVAGLAVAVLAAVTTRRAHRLDRDGPTRSGVPRDQHLSRDGGRDGRGGGATASVDPSDVSWLTHHVESRPGAAIALVVASVAAAVTIVGSGLSLDGSDRADTLLYGRYIDPYAVVLVVLVAGARAWRSAAATRVAVVLVAVAGVVVLLESDQAVRPALGIMTLATRAVWTAVDGQVATVAVIGVIASVLGVTLAHRADPATTVIDLTAERAAVGADPRGWRVASIALVAVALLAVPSVVSGHRHVARLGDLSAEQWTAAPVVAAELAALGDDCLAHDRTGVPAYAWTLYRMRLPAIDHRAVDLGAGEAPCSPIVIAATRADGAPPAGCTGAELLVDEPRAAWGAWRWPTECSPG